MSDILDDLAGSPRCPDCHVLLREQPGGWTCPERGHREDAAAIEMPDDHDGPALPGF